MILRLCISLLLLIPALVVLEGQGFTNVKPIENVGAERTITAIAIDRENNKYIGTGAGLLRIGNDGVVESIYNGSPIHALAWNFTYGLWAGVNDNTLLQPETGERIVLEGENLLIKSMAFSGGRLWVGTNQGLYVVSVNRQEITKHYTPENSKMESAVVNYVYVDKSRIKWIGTDAGVVRVENEKWKVYERDSRITAITGNDEGVWIAATDEMWLVDHFNRWTPTNVEDGLSQGRVRALAADGKGRIYVLSEIFTQFDPYSDEVLELENNFSVEGQEQVALLCDLEDKLWVSTFDQGLLSIDLEKSEDSPLVAFVVAEHPGCAGDTTGALSISAQGGAPPYQVDWGSPGVQGLSPRNLPPGDYSAVVSDSEGNTYPLDVRLEEPRPMEVSIQQLSEVSVEGAADAQLRAIFSGGTGDLDYTWNNGGRTRTISVGAGLHKLVVTDRNGCSATAQVLVEDGPAVIVEEPEIEPTLAADELSEEEEAITSIDTETIKRLTADKMVVGQTLRIEQLYFKADSTDVQPESHIILDEIYQFLISNSRIVIEIGGHTNSLPEHSYCDWLSTERAKSVADYLYSKGIPEGRISYKGYGKRNPIASNDTVMGRRQNQRVEIKILEI
jgi:outer membrane protein OmpA-like peptidoglycan-associated protein